MALPEAATREKHPFATRTEEKQKDPSAVCRWAARKSL